MRRFIHIHVITDNRESVNETGLVGVHNIQSLMFMPKGIMHSC